MSKIQDLCHRTNKQLNVYNHEYHDSIPLYGIFDVVERNIGMVVQEDGTRWSGLLLGEVGRADFKIANFRYNLHLSWYKMGSGRYEVVAYVA